MRILMIASEAAPFAKTGGLADVVGALPRALVRSGHECDVIIPRYSGIAAGEWTAQLPVALGGISADVNLYSVVRDGVRTLFVDHPRYFDREYLYGAIGHDYADNPERFAFFSQAAVTWATTIGGDYDVVHAHDWQAGLAPVLLSGMFRAQVSSKRLPTVFTIHNLAYQGIFDASWLPVLGLGWHLMSVDALEYWGRISFLKGGIVFSRLLTTVSPRYAQEIQTPELGFGFDGILRHRSSDLIGILNGIDYDQWDPECDPHLPAPYNAHRLEGKRAAKRAVLEAFGVPVTEEHLRRMLIGMVSRLVDQKGFDLLAGVADRLPQLDATVVLLGSGESRYEDQWRALAARYSDRIGARIGFDERLAHLIEGGVDLFLMPSQFEPCGLNQMYSLRYGTIPLVRATGGLYDTVRDVDRDTEAGTGFTFEEYSADALLRTLQRALAVYEDRERWRRIQRAGMAQDYSWDASAQQYVQVYEQAAVPRVWV
jgi:starch synthase